MKRILVLCVFLFAGLPFASGQESTSKSKVGLGIAIQPVSLFTTGGGVFSTAMTPVTFSIPIELEGGTRIEPEIGLYRYSSETGTVTTTTRTTSFYRLGGGVLFPVMKGENTTVYLGPKVGFFFVSDEVKSNSTTKTSETDFFVSLNVGGDHAVSASFHVFAEAQFYYLSFGQPDYSPAPPTPSDRTQSIVFTNAVIGIRFYF